MRLLLRYAVALPVLAVGFSVGIVVLLSDLFRKLGTSR